MATQSLNATESQTHKLKSDREVSTSSEARLNGNCTEPGNASDVTPCSGSLTIGCTVQEDEKRMSQARKYFGNLVIGVVIATVWVLLALPIVIYHLPLEQVPQPNTYNVSNSSLRWCNVSDVNCTIKCHEDFYLDESVGYCRPHCGRWKIYSSTIQAVSDAFIVMSATGGIIAAIAVIILAFFRHKKVFKFPSVFIIFQTITVSVYAVFILIGYTDKETLFCSSDDVVESMDSSTPFCTIIGIVSYYAVLQLALWAVFHVAAVFWAVVFEFQKQKLDAEGKTKYIHAALILLGLILPCVPIAVTFGTGGFIARDVQFPPIVCLGQDRSATVYSLGIAESVLTATGISLLIIVFRKTIKVYGFNLKRSKGAELRVLIVFSYYVILGVSALTALCISSRSLQGYSNALDAYFLCERNGTGAECNRSGFESFTNPALVTIGNILVGIYPAVNLVYVIHIADLKDLKQRCALCCK